MSQKAPVTLIVWFALLLVLSSTVDAFIQLEPQHKAAATLQKSRRVPRVIDVYLDFIQHARCLNVSAIADLFDDKAHGLLSWLGPVYLSKSELVDQFERIFKSVVALRASPARMMTAGDDLGIFFSDIAVIYNQTLSSKVPWGYFTEDTHFLQLVPGTRRIEHYGEYADLPQKNASKMTGWVTDMFDAMDRKDIDCIDKMLASDFEFKVTAAGPHNKEGEEPLVYNKTGFLNLLQLEFLKQTKFSYKIKTIRATSIWVVAHFTFMQELDGVVNVLEESFGRWTFDDKGKILELDELADRGQY